MAKKFKNLNSAFFLSLKFKKINSAFLLSIFIFIFSVFIINSAETAFAQTQEAETMYFTPQIEIPFSSISGKTAVGSADQDGKVTSNLLANYLSAIYDYGIMIGGILAVIMIMAGGIIWLTSRGDSGQVGKAKTIITGSISGLVILFGAYFILNTINPDLVKMKGIEMIVAQNVEINTVSCCSPLTGMLKINIKTTNGKSVYADSTSIVGKKAGEEFKGCWGEFLAEDCQDGTCNQDKKVGEFVCRGPNNPVCCSCMIGDLMISNRYNSCKDNISLVECDKFCAEEIKKYNIQDGKEYRIIGTNWYSARYTCEDTNKGQLCDYKKQSGSSW